MLMWEQLRKTVCGQMKNMLSKERENTYKRYQKNIIKITMVRKKRFFLFA